MRLLWAGILVAVSGVVTGLMFIGPAAALVIDGGTVPHASPDALTAAAETPRQETLVLGRVTRNPAEHFSRLQVFNDHLAARLAEDGVQGGQVIMTRDLPAMAACLRAAEVDYLVESIYGALVLEQEGLVEIALSVHRQGLESYRSLLITREDRRVDLYKLAGGHVLFKDPGSTTGFFLPWLLLRSYGYRLVPEGDKRAGEPHTLTYAFAGTETALAMGILRGKGDIGALSDRDWRSRGKVPQTLRDDLKILSESDPVLHSLLLLRTDLPAERKAALLKSLAELAESPDGAAVLDQSRMKRIAPLSPGDQEQLTRLRALHRQHAEELP